MQSGETDPATAPFWELMRDFWRPRAAAAAVQLGIPDIMGDAQMTSAEIAERVGADPLAVLRLMRALAAMGVCSHRGGTEFGLTAAGHMLRAVGQTRGHAAHMGNVLWTQFAAFDDLVRRGRPAVTSEDAGFDSLSSNPAALAAFHASLAAQSLEVVNDVVKVYDFSQYRTVIDVGGGIGGLVCGLLERFPAMTGKVFDLPLLDDHARRHLASAGLAQRTDFIGGDFFAEVPTGADAYLLKHILHDWDDDQALRILQSCRKAAGANGVVLVIEHLVPERIEDSSADRAVIGLDLIMMGYGGRERTLREYSDLFERAGLTLTQAAPGPLTGFCVFEGVASKTGPDTVPAPERSVEKTDREIV